MLARAELVISLCDRFKCLPSELAREDPEILRMVGLYDMMHPSPEDLERQREERKEEDRERYRRWVENRPTEEEMTMMSSEELAELSDEDIMASMNVKPLVDDEEGGDG